MLIKLELAACMHYALQSCHVSHCSPTCKLVLRPYLTTHPFISYAFIPTSTVELLWNCHLQKLCISFSENAPLWTLLHWRLSWWDMAVFMMELHMTWFWALCQAVWRPKCCVAILQPCGTWSAGWTFLFSVGANVESYRYFTAVVFRTVWLGDMTKVAQFGITNCLCRWRNEGEHWWSSGVLMFP